MLDGIQLRLRLIASGIATPDQIVPCSSEDIDRVKRGANGHLPKSYVDFLKVAGRGAGHFLRDIDIFYDRMIGLNERAREILRDWHSALTMPENAFVFADRRREQFMFFINDGTTDDPPVVFYFEGRPQFTRLADSIWSFLEAELRAEEQLRREFPDELWRRSS